MYRRFFIPVLALTVLLAGCRREAPPAPAPEPTGPSQAELDRMRADSIAQARAEAERAAEAERQRQEELARQRAIAAARDILGQRVHFDLDESRIRPDAEQALRQKADILRASPNVRLRLEGHADERGSNEYNLALGNRRAESVLQFFTSFGLDASRFTTVSYGEERPLVNQSNESAWDQNRRVEFIVTAGQDQINPAR
ncbi:MAG: peptidoglycan-associated lipoprotein Pal [Gemmatimonadota bacterium]